MGINPSLSPLTAASLLLFSCLSAIASDCSSDWLPLQTGNYWIYRSNSRLYTGQHFTSRVLGPYELDGKIYCQIEETNQNYLIRVDEDGRIFRRQFLNPNDELLLDPRSLEQSPLNSPLGFTTQAITSESILPLLRETSVYAKGIGLISSRSDLIAGSSGGFALDKTLIEAFIDGRLYRQPPTPALSLELASEFRNCAIPCYFAACGLGSPVDPPNTFKPCLEARIAATQLPPGSNLSVSIQSLSGLTRFEQSIPISHPNPTSYLSLPFYNQASTGQPVTPFPSGVHLVTLTAFDPRGNPLATATRFTQQ